MGVVATRKVGGSTVYTPPRVKVWRDAVRAQSNGWPSWDWDDNPGQRLEPLTLRWGSSGELTTLTLRYPIATDDPAGRRINKHPFKAGDRIRLEHLIHQGRKTVPQEVFRGYVGQIGFVYQAQPDVEAITLTAYGPEIFLRNTVPLGPEHLRPDYEDAIIAGTTYGNTPITMGEFTYAPLNTYTMKGPIVFNPNGKPNAFGKWTHPDNGPTNGDTAGRHFFCETNRLLKLTNGNVVLRSIHWTAYSAAHWLVRQARVPGVSSRLGIDTTELDALKTTLDALPLNNVRITGMNILDALVAVLRPVGWGFCIDPWVVSWRASTTDQADAEDDYGEGLLAAHRLRLFSLRGDENIRDGPWVQDRENSITASSAAGQYTDVQRIAFNRDSHNARNQVTVIGGQKELEVYLEWDGDSQADIRPLWNKDATATDLDEFDDSNVVNYASLKKTGNFSSFVGSFTYGAVGGNVHAYRSWVMNEDGRHSPRVTDYPTAAEMDKYEDSDGRYVRIARPLTRTSEYTESTVKAEKKQGRVEIGIKGLAGSWIPVENCTIRDDCCGFTFTRKNLFDWYPFKEAINRTISAGGGDFVYKKYGGYSYLTLLHNALRSPQGTPSLMVRMVGIQRGDARAIGRATYTLGYSAWPFLADRVIYDPGRFIWRADETSSERTLDTRDDRDAAGDYADRVRNASEGAMGHGSIMLRGIVQHYKPGDAIRKTRGWELDLSVDAQGNRAPIVTEVTWDYREGAMMTELILDTPMMRVVR